MYERFTDRARKVMQLANQEAQRFNHEYIGTEHILLGLVKEGSGVAGNVLKNLDVDLRKIRLEIEKIVVAGPEMVTIGKLPQTPRTRKVIEYAIEEARTLNHNYVGTEHLLLGLLREQEGVAAQVLMNLGMNLESVREEVLNLLGHNVIPNEPKVPDSIANLRQDLNRLGRPPGTQSRTPVLDCFGRDLTELARQDKVDPVIGRDHELDRLVRILCRRTRRRVLLLGEAGVGKTALAAGLARLLASGQAPLPLQGHRLISVDLASLVASTERRGQILARLEAIRHEADLQGNVILFLDDLHLWATNRMVAFALAATLDALPCCIATATSDNGSRLDEEVGSLARFFLPVRVPPLPPEAVRSVARHFRDVCQAHHLVSIPDAAVSAAVDLAATIGTGAALLQRVLDVIDEAAACVRLRATSRPPDVSPLENEIEQLNLQKDAAVAEQDFEKAAALRDRADKLAKRKQSILEEWRGESMKVHGVVDEEVVREVVFQTFGLDGKGI